MSQPWQNEVPQTLVVGEDDAEEYLGRLGITIDLVRLAVERGEGRAMEASGPEYPRTAAGLSRWIETVGTLRRGLVGDGWQLEDAENRPICANAERTILVGVLGGTAATGDPDSELGPKAQRRKGPATDAALHGQLVLYVRADLVGSPVGVTLSDPPPSGAWFVVYHRGETGVQVEVSYPRGSTDGQIDGWVVRILLPRFTPDAVDVSPQDVGGGDVGFDVTLAS
ncbi:hypothetical protein [Gordonia phthalatica]|uniref:Uncharacterized protein n=1 Tax=Gordonia phthalatica TaxID=1136941 RepID=A0A0N9NFE1_9ACTN|nr:hypothetical protein [Gordonia phthalatica]ALG86433.1 hypothetical protein ACH46_20480 [Gordonia phthalatica]